MVLKVMIEDNLYYACSLCGLIYKDKVDAALCEEWCSKHGSCNITLSRKAIGSITPDTGLRLGGAS